MKDSKSPLQRFINNPMVQAMAIYISSGWILIELLEYFIENFSLIEKSRNILLIILLCGLPVTLFLSWYLNRERKESEEERPSIEEGSQQKSKGLFKRLVLAIPLIVITILTLVFGAGYLNHRSKAKQAREEVLPEVYSLNDKGQFAEALALLNKSEKYLAENPQFNKLKSKLARKLNIITDPPGAEIYMKEYSDISGEWQFVGVSPIDSLELAMQSYHRVKIIKQGYEEVLAICTFADGTFLRKLFPEGEIPEGMVYADGLGAVESGRPGDQENGFFIDRYEVSNKQYKDFVDQGGYTNRSYWKHEFVKEGQSLSWEEAMAEFTDKSDRPGPAGWEASDFPAGEAQIPVSGISWYEAAAYAEYEGKSLPTADHWYTGAGLNYFFIQYYLSSSVIKLSNFHGPGPDKIGKNQGMSAFGAYDMAGNVREWCWNESTIGHVVRGGGWNDAGYLYNDNSQAPSFDRSSKNGFRCALYIHPEKISIEVFEPVDRSVQTDFYAEEAVDESIFQVYKRNFDYDPKNLDARVEEKTEAAGTFSTEKVTFTAAYENERVIAYLYLPENASPPYPTLVYFPGSYALRTREFRPIGFSNFGFLLKNGYAVLYPVYKGSYERGSDNQLDVGFKSHTFTNYTIRAVQDFKRSVDYLESRSDIDSAKIGYLGHSWGSALAGIILAADTRPKLAILTTGGLRNRDVYPEVDPFNYWPRVKIPVLMMNGRYDPIFPLESCVQPLFHLLGTPESDKRLFVSDTDHWIPQSDKIRETLNWLDRYFRPTN